MTETKVSFSVFHGGDSARTRKYLSHLEKQGQIGRIAGALFRVQKASHKAKLYSGGIERSNGEFQSYRTLSYQRKTRSLKELCSLLLIGSAGMEWGWGRDEENARAPHVLYLDLPSGQVRFHSDERFAGPDYPRTLVGECASEERIISYCDQFAEGLVLPPERPREVRELDSWTDVAWED